MTHDVKRANGGYRQREDVAGESSAGSTSDSTGPILGHSMAIRALHTQIQQLMTFDVVGSPHIPTLLLQGETGTGKGLVARVIHESGPRVHGPFLEVNCAAIPEPLLEAELFGFEAGAFTDAKRAKPGLFESASGGTLFLDEVDALPLLVQSKLLTAIESKRVRRLGAVRDQRVDVKLIAATPTNLSQQVVAGDFRADLYHRLAVILLTLPPLRERGEDILILARHFLHRYLEIYRLPSRRLSRSAEVWLMRRHWPGNVRELSHLIERVTLLSSASIIDPQVLQRLCLPHPEPVEAIASSLSGGNAPLLDEPDCIRQALLQAEGNVMRASRLLGISRGALRYRMRQYGIDLADRKGVEDPLGSISRGTIVSPPLQPVRVWKRLTSSVTPEDAARHPTVIYASPRLEYSWEQKPIAVLAISLSHFLGADLKNIPADPWAVVTDLGRYIVRQLTGFGGFVLLRSPSMFIAGFGVYGNLERLPEHVVQAAVAIRQRFAVMTRSDMGQAGKEIRMAIHQGIALVDARPRGPTARVLPTADTMTLTLKLLVDAAPGEILLSPQVARLVEESCELRVPEISLGDQALDRSGAYAVANEAWRESPPGYLRGTSPISMELTPRFTRP
jgi:two-component system, NtrC family, response regulator AtoC